MIEKSKALEKLYFDYTNLPLGEKRVRCPYWSNTQKTLLAGPYKGKGTPGQITRATKVAAKSHNLDLRKLSTGDIRRFMEHYRIGIDCSGFVYHMADALDREKGGSGIKNRVEGVKGRGVRRVNAFCLTNEKNSLTIEKVGQIRVGDFIRFTWGSHIAIVTRIKRNARGLPTEVTYAHSCRLSAITGVHTGRIKIVEPEKDISEQKWFEKTKKGYEYVLKYYSKKHGDSLRRLKIWVSP